MSDSSTTTIRAIFETREAADLVVDHLVKKRGAPRPDIFIEAAHDADTTGSLRSGGCFLLSYARDNTPLEGEIEVSADIAEKQLATIQRTICEIGAMRISRR
ncbi:hypothetical protein N7E02_07545 (plasmid) [Aliirhizobium terrae]|uniref:hypothetical protein n=1 Tax=Terrirhizobium terrae TaxID=2926709 RepID=UPI002576BD80|nr:hypothetical protein [Rhizobium sp. CC-CFT758]WJH38464.1 hypothetical protein N7E02_07545 [Rhizobium sp. CC-CFT758]